MQTPESQRRDWSGLTPATRRLGLATFAALLLLIAAVSVVLATGARAPWWIGAVTVVAAFFAVRSFGIRATEDRDRIKSEGARR